VFLVTLKIGYFPAFDPIYPAAACFYYNEYGQKPFQMKYTGIVVMMATLYAIIFNASPFIGIPEEIIFTMFVFSPFVLIYMVYVVLKYGKPSGHTFEERWYDDIEPQ